MSASTVSLPANLLQDVETYVEDYIHTRVGATFVYQQFPTHLRGGRGRRRVGAALRPE